VAAVSLQESAPKTQPVQVVVYLRYAHGFLCTDHWQHEPLHQAVVAFFDQNTAQLITSPICIAEVLCLLGNPGNPAMLAAQDHLLPEDNARVADLTLVCLSERLDIAEILALDSDFDVYRRFRRQPFCRIPLG
jgi:predicted nucleic acid-binding protein